MLPDHPWLDPLLTDCFRGHVRLGGSGVMLPGLLTPISVSSHPTNVAESTEYLAHDCTGLALHARCHRRVGSNRRLAFLAGGQGQIWPESKPPCGAAPWTASAQQQQKQAQSWGAWALLPCQLVAAPDAGAAASCLGREPPDRDCVYCKLALRHCTCSVCGEANPDCVPSHCPVMGHNQDLLLLGFVDPVPGSCGPQ